jgi:hypothetical protein
MTTTGRLVCASNLLDTTTSMFVGTRFSVSGTSHAGFVVWIPAALGVIEDGLRDSDNYVRGQAESAADDAQHFLRWKISRSN